MLPFVLIDSLEHTLCGAGMASYGLVEHIAGGAGTLAVSAVWQGLAVAAALTAALRLLPRLAAAQRFALWLAAFVVLLALPFLPALGTAMPHSAAAFSPAPSSHPWLALDVRWSLAVVALWALAALARASDLIAHSFGLRRMWRMARPIICPTSLEPVLDGLKGRRFEICTVSDLDRPSVIGFFRPRILIPDWLFPRLTSGELEQIVLHEFEHLRRGDDWTNLLQKVGMALFPLNPALWFIEARLTREREMACDEAVVRITRAPRAYAACLASLAERGQERRAEALSLGAWQRRSELVRRVQSILRGKRGLAPGPARFLVGVVVSSLLVVALELARCPQLIAFVPRPMPYQQRADARASQLEDGMYPPVPRRRSDVPQFFALPAKALAPLPAARAGGPQRGPGAVGSHAVGELRASSAAANSVSASSHPQDRNRASAHLDPADARQFVVFTSWEQVDATADPGDRVADYDPGPAARASEAKDAPGEDAAHAAGVTGSRVTVTRLVLRIVPTDAKSASKSGCKTGVPLPATIPFGDGWLVLQL